MIAQRGSQQPVPDARIPYTPQVRIRGSNVCSPIGEGIESSSVDPRGIWGIRELLKRSGRRGVARAIQEAPRA
jgi:hypothetical protein